MKKVLILILFLMLSIQLLKAQRVLVVQKLGSKRRYQYPEGEKLKLKLKDSKEVLRGKWRYLGEHSIWMSGQEVDLRNVRWVDISSVEKGIWILRKGQDLLSLAGVVYFSVSQINALYETGELETDRSVSRTSISLLAGDLDCRIMDRTLRPRKVRIGNRYRVYLVELS